MRIQAAVLQRPDGIVARRKITIEEVELDAPRAEKVLVRVTSCGVCGTDRGCIHGIEPFPTPGVLGHEGAGVVEDVGPGVTLVKPGDRVVMGFPFRGSCRYCRAGQPRYCEFGSELMFSGRRLDRSTPMRSPEGEELAGRFFQQSSWASHTVTQERQLVVVPDGFDADLFGPLGGPSSRRAAGRDSIQCFHDDPRQGS